MSAPFPYFSSPPLPSEKLKENAARRSLGQHVEIATTKLVDASLVPIHHLSEALVGMQKTARKHGEVCATVENRLRLTTSQLKEETETLSYTEEALKEARDSDPFDNMQALVESASSKFRHLRHLRGNTES